MKKIYLLFTAVLVAMGSYANVATVANGTSTQDFAPVWGGWAHMYLHSQSIYSEDLLGELNKDASISALTFYIASPASKSWTCNFQVGLAIITEDAISNSGSYYTPYAFNQATLTTVYSGSLDGTGSTMTITFSSPFEYKGGNLLLDIRSITTGAWSDIEFYGANQTKNVSVYYKDNSSVPVNESDKASTFLPKVDITFTAGKPITCQKPTSIAASNMEANAAKLSWTAGGTEDTWNIQYRVTGEENWKSVKGVKSNPYTLEGLSPITTYEARVQAACSTDDESLWSDATSFKTECGLITVLPWEENFSTATGLPDCWSQSGDGTLSILNKSLMFGFSEAGSHVVILPEFGIRLDTLAISFRYYTSEYDAMLQLGYINASNEFVAIGGTYSTVKEYKEIKNVKLEGIPETTKQLAFRYSAGEICYVYLDDVTIHVPEVETGIESIQKSEVSVQKVIEDGQIYLIYEGQKYNVLGTKLN